MISLTIEAETLAELIDKLNNSLNLNVHRVLSDAPNVAESAEPVVGPKKPRGRPKKKEPETIEATAETVTTEPDTNAESGDDLALTRDNVKEAAYAYMEARMAQNPDDKDAGNNAFRELLDAFNTPRLSKLPEDKFAEAIEWAKAKTAAVEAETTE